MDNVDGGSDLLFGDAIFHCLPLDLTNLSVRVFKILPELRDGFIQCQMRRTIIPCAATPEEQRYTAVSYVWGPPSPCQWILVNGQVRKIRFNLWQFLEEMRYQQRSGLFWADAICT